VGRKKIQIDWNLVDDMLSKFCDGTEIAEALGINKETLYNAVQREKKLDYSDYKAQKRAEKKASLRAKQIELAEKGDRGMLIWLGKQYLNQSDRQQQDIKISQDLPFEIEFECRKPKEPTN
jgi:IS30 family transposase